jgi:hypothetical protein
MTRRILSSALISVALAADPCDQFCRFFDYANLCGPNTSHCQNGEICSNLFWTVAESGRRSAYFGDLDIIGATPITCADADRFNTHLEYPGVVPNMSPMITMLQILSHLGPVLNLDWITDNPVLLSLAQIFLSENTDEMNEIANNITDYVGDGHSDRRDAAAFHSLLQHIPETIFGINIHYDFECSVCDLKIDDTLEPEFFAPIVTDSVAMDFSNLEYYREKLNMETFCPRCLSLNSYLRSARPTHTGDMFTISIPRTGSRLVHPVTFSRTISVSPDGARFRLVAISHYHGNGSYTAEILQGTNWYVTNPEGLMRLADTAEPATISRTVSMLFYQRI